MAHRAARMPQDVHVVASSACWQALPGRPHEAGRTQRDACLFVRRLREMSTATSAASSVTRSLTVSDTSDLFQKTRKVPKWSLRCTLPLSLHYRVGA